MIWSGEVQQKGLPKLDAPPPPLPVHHPFITSSSSMTSLDDCININDLIRRYDRQQDPPYPHFRIEFNNSYPGDRL
ncbi:hypothetical protein Tco_0188848 [Tanacetum coccineum]